jgi:enoyl-CoA hydratase/carnithine racemase
MASHAEMDHGLARVETDGHRADVVLDRAHKRNAMSEQLMRDLTEAFRTVEDLEDVRSVVMLGEGPVLCAGMDLEMMRERADAPEEFDHGLFPDLLDTIADCPLPTVAAIHGAAPAGGFELSLPFDFRVIGSDAKYGVIEVQLGTFPHGGATQRLPRLVGMAKAKEFVLAGEFIDPEEAERHGLVNEVVEPGAVKDRARELADDLATNAPLGMVRAKELLNAAPEMSVDEGLSFERALGREIYETHDYREGIQARLDGRDPEFENR